MIHSAFSRGAWALVAVTMISESTMASLRTVLQATNSTSGIRGLRSRMKASSSATDTAATLQTFRPGRTAFMPRRCILACSPAPMKPMDSASFLARTSAAVAPMAATRILEQSVPSITQTGKPFSISERTIIAERFCTPKRRGLGGKTETHFTPQIFSSSSVAGS